ncbi:MULTISPECIES: family 43 glycosylhydrolase [Paenibacillus]|uniref:family 43 glycosylhydrolase n=1 Tax=Paenibacillus TaxID=44249 RepID=UPI00096E3447|nr:family 43 glycosylhydrolase [Paenibacillus peoriae]OMF76883.1 xylosidase [Paenibacillus peoriae]
MTKQAINPFLPRYEYVPDGEPYVFGDRVYIYGSHDKFNGIAFFENNYICWSADVNDLGNWKYEGVIYEKTQDPMCNDPEKRMLYAADVQVGPDGRYYLYYAFDLLGVIAVAVSDTPAGKYEFYGHVHYVDGTLLGDKEGDTFQFDPSVLVDDDGRMHLYTGFCMEHFSCSGLGFQTEL